VWAEGMAYNNKRERWGAYLWWTAIWIHSAPGTQAHTRLIRTHPVTLNPNPSFTHLERHIQLDDVAVDKAAMEPDLTNELDLHENNYDVWGDFCMSTHVYIYVCVHKCTGASMGGGCAFSG
jgi:hypothetical protein